MKDIVQYWFDHPTAFWLGLAAFIVADIVVVILYGMWCDRKADKNLPSYMKAYDRKGRRIK